MYKEVKDVVAEIFDTVDGVEYDDLKNMDEIEVDPDVKINFRCGQFVALIDVLQREKITFDQVVATVDSVEIVEGEPVVYVMPLNGTQSSKAIRYDQEDLFLINRASTVSMFSKINEGKEAEVLAVLRGAIPEDKIYKNTVKEYSKNPVRHAGVALAAVEAVTQTKIGMLESEGRTNRLAKGVGLHITDRIVKSYAGKEYISNIRGIFNSRSGKSVSFSVYLRNMDVYINNLESDILTYDERTKVITFILQAIGKLGLAGIKG